MGAPAALTQVRETQASLRLWTFEAYRISKCVNPRDIGVQEPIAIIRCKAPVWFKSNTTNCSALGQCRGLDWFTRERQLAH